MGEKIRGNKTLSGTWAEVWVDGDKIFECSKIEMKVTANREDVQLDLDVDSKITGLKGEFTLGVKKVYTRYLDVFENWKKGIDQRAQIITKLQDPDAVGGQIERYATDRLYFVPKTHMEKVAIFEDFIQALNESNQNSTTLTVNSMYVMDDEKQREKMATEFYVAMSKEIEEYQERVQHLITTDSQSIAIMNRWILKIQGLEAKTKQYEDILNRQLNKLNGEFAVLQTFSQELNARIRGLERKKAA